jgi:hypothetical protein
MAHVAANVFPGFNGTAGVHLHMNVDVAAHVPTGINGNEFRGAARIGHLHSPKEPSVITRTVAKKRRAIAGAKIASWA